MYMEINEKAEADSAKSPDYDRAELLQKNTHSGLVFRWGPSSGMSMCYANFPPFPFYFNKECTVGPDCDISTAQTEDNGGINPYSSISREKGFIGKINDEEPAGRIDWLTKIPSDEEVKTLLKQMLSACLRANFTQDRVSPLEEEWFSVIDKNDTHIQRYDNSKQVLCEITRIIKKIADNRGYGTTWEEDEIRESLSYLDVRNYRLQGVTYLSDNGKMKYYFVFDRDGIPEDTLNYFDERNDDLSLGDNDINYFKVGSRAR